MKISNSFNYFCF